MLKSLPPVPSAEGEGAINFLRSPQLTFCVHLFSFSSLLGYFGVVTRSAGGVARAFVIDVVFIENQWEPTCQSKYFVYNFPTTCNFIARWHELIGFRNENCPPNDLSCEVDYSRRSMHRANQESVLYRRAKVVKWSALVLRVNSSAEERRGEIQFYLIRRFIKS